ncbi:MAG: universal stress protein [Micromonosporaceae bacterium]
MAAQQIRHLRTHVVVGTDGSESANDAVAWAAREAKLRSLPLRVVHGYVWPYVHAPLGAAGYLEAGDGLRDAPQRLLADAEQVARTAAPEVPVETTLVATSATAALLEWSHDAALLVVGSRGLGGFSSLLLGSTAVQAAMYASCPVVTVREAETTEGVRPVVVGVDAPNHAVAALAFAYEDASLRRAPLVAVHAWTEPVSTGPGDMLPLVYDPAEVQDDETRLLAELLAGWSEKYPDVPVTRRVERGRARDVLIEESHRAQLVVVGARGVGGFRGLLFGSVSQAVLHHAHCPVAVVRAGD